MCVFQRQLCGHHPLGTRHVRVVDELPSKAILSLFLLYTRHKHMENPLRVFSLVYKVNKISIAHQPKKQMQQILLKSRLHWLHEGDASKIGVGVHALNTSTFLTLTKNKLQCTPVRSRRFPSMTKTLASVHGDS